MITIESISKSFGGQVLFSNAGLQINPGEKVGLVGRNGHGKTTLLKMITHGEEPDSGQIQIPGDYRLGYLTQHIAFTGKTVLEECMAGLPIHEKDHSWKAEKILAGLGFSDEDMQREPAFFSGGYQVRLTLARVLVSDPDLLVLDEPTNYLDIISIRWLTSFLKTWPREILLVTHDRGFMDGVVTHIAGIHRGVIRKIQGNTEKYYEQIAQDEEIYEKTRVNEEKRRNEMETFITRFRAKARLAGMVQSRVKALAKMGKKDSLKKIESLSFSFRDLPFAGKQLLTGENMTFSYEASTPLITDVNLMVQPGDRIAIVGKNGKGKTTLLKLLATMLEPVAGTVKYNPGVEMGYFEQTNVQSLNLNATVEEEMLYAHEDMDRQQARNICGALMFEGDDALKHISVLSGGEKSRVMLGKLLAQPLNLLLLDEPTNHLDAESVGWLEQHLSRYEGTVIAVTHDRYFLDNVAGWILELDRGEGIPWKGNYSSWLEQKQKRLATEQRTESKRQQTLQRELEWIHLSPKGKRSKSKARIKAYEDLLKKDVKQQESDLEIFIPPGPRLGEKVIVAKDISKAFENKLLVENMNFIIPPGGIIGVVGPNGAGKTTLFNMITARETPDSGTIELGQSVKLAYVDQERDTLDPERTIFEIISDGNEKLFIGGREINARAYVAKFNFSGSDQQKKVKNISGGERNRVHLATLLKREANVLLLDEPTNDLDVNTLRALEEALENFAGCAVIISHDRWFLDRIATHILAFEGDSQTLFFEGSYSDYEKDRKKRLGIKAGQPTRIKYRQLTR
ncbi:MAG: energy-dependent translational throttle protein EttA [Desulfobacula sp.]|nr:energy-dependent translational throttle protein EttA [Desulfobacula sp.]